jgi:hypothetical protein
VLGWSDPTFAHDCVAKVNRGSLQPNNRLRAVRACGAKNLGETGAEGRNYLPCNFVFTTFFTVESA